MEYLTSQNRAGEGDQVDPISARGKHVIIIGGGDTGADCLGTAHRQGARSVRQLEVLQRPPDTRAPQNPWPTWPNIFRVSSAHEEGGERLYAIATERFAGTADGRVARLHATEIETKQPVELDADLVLLAMGFVGPERGGLIERAGDRTDGARHRRPRRGLDDERPRRLRRRRHAARPVADRLGDRRRPELRARRRHLSDGQLVAAGARRVAAMPTSPSSVETARAELCAAARAATAAGPRCGASRTASTISCGASSPTRPAPRRQPHRRARRLRSAAAVPAVGRRRPAAVRRPDRTRRGRIVCAPSCIRCGICASRSAIRSARLDDFVELEIDNPEFLLALLDARAVAGDATLLDRIAARVRTPAAHARILDALTRLIDERHARFNDTFYQLEPDVKDAPGALRDLWAARTIADADRSGADRSRPRRSRPSRRRRRIPAAPALDAARRAQTQQERAESRDAGAGRDTDGLRRRAAPAGRAPDGRLLPSRARRQPIARVGPPDRAGAGRAPTSCGRATAFDSSTPNGADAHPESWLSLFQAAIETGTPVADETLTWIQQRRRALSRRRRSFRAPRSGDGAARVSEAARGTLRATVGDARLRTARTDVPRVPGDLLPRRARLLSQVHRRRAHAADDSKPRTPRDGCGEGPRALQRAASPIWRTRNCWCCRCSSTTSANGATTTTPRKACAWRWR